MPDKETNRSQFDWGFRVPFLLTIIFVGWFSGSQFRTSVFGGNLAGDLAMDAFGWLILGFGACPVMTFCCVLGLPWKQGAIIFCMAGILTILAIEAFARAQEYIVINTYGRNPERRSLGDSMEALYGKRHVLPSRAGLGRA